MTKRSKNPNHPKKGQVITVDPIRNMEKIREINSLLTSKPRDLLLFTMGINSGLRVGDLLRFKVSDFMNLSDGETFVFRESKTGKKNFIKANLIVLKQYKIVIEKNDLKPNDFLFKSRKGNAPLTIQAVNNYVKKWTASVGLNGNYGAHSLRKTWGYHQRKTYGVGYELIAKRYNHSNPAVTMRYLGIEDIEIHEILNNVIG